MSSSPQTSPETGPLLSTPGTVRDQAHPQQALREHEAGAAK